MLGSYLLRPDGQAQALVLDVDGPAADESGRQRAHEVALELCATLARVGLRPLVLDSGGKGRHLWLCFAAPVPAGAARRWAQGVVDAVRPLSAGVLVEVFPKQDYLPAGAMGALLRLPLGRHPQTGRFSYFLDAEGQPVADPWTLLRAQPLIDRLALGLSGEAALPAAQPPLPPDAVAPMVDGCALLRGLVDKAARLRHLRHTERLALLYTLGHCGGAGSAYLHQVMALCGNYDARDTDRWLQRLEEGHPPISCSRLKEWLADYLPGVECPCPARRGRGSPLDHLRVQKKARPAVATAPLGALPTSLGDESGVQKKATPLVATAPVAAVDDGPAADAGAVAGIDAWAGVVEDLFGPPLGADDAGGVS